MTREECKRIVMIITKTYPTFYQKLTVQDLTDMVDAWNFFLADYQYNDVAIALKTFVTSQGSAYPPNAGQLIEMLYRPKKLSQMEDMEAWAKVRKAIRNGTYGAEDEFARLDPLIQKCIGDPGMLRNWAKMDSETIDSVVCSNFCRTYRAKAKSQEELSRMPVEVKARLEQAGLGLLEVKDED